MFSKDNQANNVWTEFDDVLTHHRTNIKLAHLNVNNIAGFKFWDIQHWLLSEKFDVLILSGTKLDFTFSSSQFHVGEYCLCRADRNRFGGGLMVFVKNNICFTKVTEFQRLQANEWAGYRTETIALRLKVWKSWHTVFGLYRPPSIPTQQWTQELSPIFKTASLLTDDVNFLGDFNCDLLQPDAGSKDGRRLNDLLDICNLSNLIHTATRVVKTSETLLDLILMDNSRRILKTGTVDAQISDHSLIYAVLRASAPRLRSRKHFFSEA